MVLSTYVCSKNPWDFIKSQAEKDSSSFSILPSELIFAIFEYLNALDLYQTMRVCSNWKIISMDNSLWNIKKIFSEFQYFEEDDFAKQIKVLKRAAANYLAIPHFLTLRKFAQQELTVITMPKGMTFKQIFKKIPKNRRFVRSKIYKQYGDVAIHESYRVAMTKYPSSTILPGFDQPRLIEITALMVLEFLKNGFFRANCSTLCEEHFNNRSDLVAGTSNNPQLFYVNMRDRLLGQEPQMVLSVYRF